MTKSLELATSNTPKSAGTLPVGWFKLGAIATVSALAGGLAAAWWYRKTLTKLRQVEENSQNPNFGIPPDDPTDESLPPDSG